MSNRCEDYPCCGHTDGLGCNWTPPTFTNPEDMFEIGSQEYWDARWEREEEEEDEEPCCDWRAEHEGEGSLIHDRDCDEYDGAPVHQWEVTEPAEVYATDDYYASYNPMTGQYDTIL